MRVITLARLLAAIRLLPSLTRRPTWRIIGRFRELREESAFNLSVNACALGMAEAELERQQKGRGNQPTT